MRRSAATGGNPANDAAPGEALIDDVRQRLGERALVTDPGDIEPWLTDWRGRWHGKSAAILQPSTTEEVAAIVALANQHGVALVPQGGNTSMVGGATPSGDGSALILSLRRMNRIRAIDRASRRAVAEAGVILQHLHEAALDQDLRFPLTLGAKGSATIGGLVSTNAGGTQVLRFGPMRSLVDGIEAVLPDGTIHHGLSGLKKDNRGYSLDQLLVGAEGTLGIVTAARLRLVPAIHSRSVAWLGLAGPQQALDTLRALEADTDRIEGFEILPQEPLGAALATFRAAAPRSTPITPGMHWSRPRRTAPTPSRRRTCSPVCWPAGRARPGGKCGDFVDRGAGRGLLADPRRPVGSGTRRLRSRHPARHQRRGRRHATVHGRGGGRGRAGLSGHQGVGLRPSRRRQHPLPRPRREQGRAGLAGRGGEAVQRLVDDLVTAVGGSISAEHGIGQMKRAELARLLPTGSGRYEPSRARSTPTAS